jgi:uncharacterized protein (DUF952 family)
LILHCLPKRKWDLLKNKKEWGEEELAKDGFIHCSTVEYFWRVAPNFLDTLEPLVIICIDESKLTSDVRYEDGDSCGRAYPHIYGKVNNDAVIQVLPFLKSVDGKYQKNPELKHIIDK